MAVIGDFNPRSRVGNDPCVLKWLPELLKFQSTFPRGERLVPAAIASAFVRFQSTFPRGERQDTSVRYPGTDHFNPRSRVGNDTATKQLRSIINSFQSTFPRGERQQILTIFHLYIRISNPNLHFNITPFHIFYLIHFFWACFFQLFMVRIFWGFSVYFWFALYRNNT